jgi:hypothetical protein
LKIIWIRRVAPTNKEATGALRKKKDQGVIVDIIITLKDNPKEDYIVAQVLLPPRGIRGLGWMN